MKLYPLTASLRVGTNVGMTGVSGVLSAGAIIGGGFVWQVKQP
jgi:hypothetical protein